MTKRRALLSVSDKCGLPALARRLLALKFELVSTGGTAALLSSEGLEVTPVSAVTGAPEILGGRVKTLHPAIHGGVLARRKRPEDLETLRDQGIEPIDLVVVNLYPFEAASRREGLLLAELLEEIDIGGPTLLRAAAKNFEDVVVVVDPNDYDAVAVALESGSVPRTQRFQLALKAFNHTAHYDRVISEALQERLARSPELGGKPPFALETEDSVKTEAQAYAKPLQADDSAPGLPAIFHGTFKRRELLRYGENPHQQAALYSDSSEGNEPLICQAQQLQGKALSYNNLLDADAALETVKAFSSCAAVVVKHLNPCGVALGEEAAATYLAARACDPVSAFGGVVAINRPVDLACAEALAETFLEIIVAPKFEAEALQRLGRKKALRLLSLEGLGSRPASWTRGGYELRSVGGGLLIQNRDLPGAAPDGGTGDSPEQWHCVTQRAPSEDELAALAFAWKVVGHVKSNAIVLCSDRQLLGVGAGQMSRVDAARLAKMRAVLPLAGCVAASDAFFPFADGLQICAEAGATAVVQPGGSKRDSELIEAANALDVAMLFTGRRHFRH